MTDKIMISAIVAIDEKRGIGKDGKLPWHIPSELKHFKETTMGHPIVMGRKTFDAVGRVLPGRTNIVITTHPFKSTDENLKVVSSIDEALRLASDASGAEEIFILGGGQIFSQVMDKVYKLYLTIIDGDFNCDTFFPDYSEFKKVLKEESRETDGFKYKILELEK
jgi:dihydrofolate reductase